MEKMMKETVVTLEEGLRIMEEGIVKARDILQGFPIKALFTGEVYMMYYTCVYSVCFLPDANGVPTSRSYNPNAVALYERFKTALEESIVSVVIPSLMSKHDGLLLAELVKMWERYKLMAKCLTGFFQYLDYHYVDHNLEMLKSVKDISVDLNLGMLKSLKDISVDCFCVLVCDSFFHRFRDAAITMILLERDGKEIDHNVLKNFLTFFLEIEESEKGSTYCKDFEQVLLAAADTSGYFSELASAWFSYDSSADYRFKIERMKFMMSQTESGKKLESESHLAAGEIFEHEPR